MSETESPHDTTTRTGRAYASDKERRIVHCDSCDQRPHLERRPGIGVVATCDCGRVQTMEMTGKFPGEWE